LFRGFHDDWIQYSHLGLTCLSCWDGCIEVESWVRALVWLQRIAFVTRQLGTHSINDFAGTMSWCWRFKKRMACIQVHKLNTIKVVCQFWKQRNCISNLDREIIWMKFPYISVSESKAVKIKGAQIIISKASGHKKICYAV